jgi:hypothetical protein
MTSSDDFHFSFPGRPKQSFIFTVPLAPRPPVAMVQKHGPKQNPRFGAGVIFQACGQRSALARLHEVFEPTLVSLASDNADAPVCDFANLGAELMAAHPVAHKTELGISAVSAAYRHASLP